jgi:hypothetical protein
VHKTTQGFFLRDLGYERNTFCELTALKMDHGKLATMRQLGSLQWRQGRRLAAVVLAGDPPTSDESAQEAPVRRLDGSVVAQQWRLGFGQIRTG